MISIELIKVIILACQVSVSVSGQYKDEISSRGIQRDCQKSLIQCMTDKKATLNNEHLKIKECLIERQ